MMHLRHPTGPPPSFNYRPKRLVSGQMFALCGSSGKVATKFTSAMGRLEAFRRQAEKNLALSNFVSHETKRVLRGVILVGLQPAAGRRRPDTQIHRYTDGRCSICSSLEAMIVLRPRLFSRREWAHLRAPQPPRPERDFTISSEVATRDLRLARTSFCAAPGQLISRPASWKRPARSCGRR